MSNPTLNPRDLEHIGDYGRVTKQDLHPLCPNIATYTVSEEELERAGIRSGGKLTTRIYEQLRRAIESRKDGKTN